MRTEKGKRVLMLLENNPYPHDGRVRLEATTLTGAGYQVSVISPSAPGQMRHEVIDEVHVFRYPAPPDGDGLAGYLWEYGYSLAATFALSLLVSFRRGFDFIHAANPPDTAVLVAAFYKLFGKRFVFDHHDLAPELYDVRFGNGGSRLVRLALLLLEKSSCRLADHIIATNESYKAHDAQRGPVPEERITVVRNGPTLRRFRAVEPKPGLRKPGKTVIIYVGIIAAQDGVDCLMRALLHLRVDLGRSDFMCFILGKGIALAGIKALATELRLDDCVTFTGFVEPVEVAAHVAAADIGVSPEPSNPLNDRSTMVKIMEYMASGKPVVAFDLPENRFTALGAALYAKPNDELDFARQLATLMDDPQRRERMGAAGRERAMNVLAWPYQAEQLLCAYRSMEPGYAPVRGAYE